ncbi:MAG: DUF2232 domain-containing protein [Gammaproteobacteria bacterium]
MRTIAQFILQGPYQVIVFAGIVGGLAQTIFILALPSAAAVALFLLRKGEKPGLTVLLGTALLTVATGLLVESRPGFDYPVALLLIFPAAAGALVLRASQAQGLAIAAISACAALFAFAVQLFSGDAEQWWSDWLKIASQGVPGANSEDFGDNVMPYINGLIALLIGLLSSACLLWARWQQAVLFNPEGFEREFRTLTLPSWAVTVMLAVLPIAALIRLELLYDLVLVAILPFFFQGLAVLQDSAVKKRLNKFLTLLPYLLLLLMPQFVIIGCACLGGADMFFNFRKLPRT